MMTEQTKISDVAIPPGEFLSEVLEEYGMTQKDLAERMARPPQMINEIVKGSKAITPETALQLEQVVNVPAHIWTGMEAEYRLILAKQKEAVSVEEEVACLSNFPYADLRKLGVVDNTRKAVEKVYALRRFLGVSSLKNLQGVGEYNPAFRLTNNHKVSKEAIISWLKAGSIFAGKIDTLPFSKAKLRSIIPELRALSLEEESAVFLTQLKDRLASVGVALVLIPHFPKTYVTGATFWESKDKAVIMMTFRGSWGDIFWFSLFHEIGHILLHDKRPVFIEGKARDADQKKQEEEADDFSRDCLIPSNEYEHFINENAHKLCEETITCFAQETGIHAGIVTGRLQHDDLLHVSQHLCRVRYKWA
jgi:HTH-type transcriptional regulator/antitoxin HigA